MEELLVEELKDLYDAEKQLVKALPKLARTASDEELRQAFQNHLEETKGQVERLEQVFQNLGHRARGKSCKGMRGLVEEGQEVMQEDASELMLDSAIIGAAQKVEHYEIAAYGTARTLAQAMGNREAAQLLQETLDEEGKTDKLLTQIAKRLLKESGRAEASSPGVGEKERGQTGRQNRSRMGGGNSPSRGQSRSRSTSGSASRSSSRSSRSGSAASRTLTDHNEIRQWAEERGAKPACVRGTGGKEDIGMLRLDFPGYSGAQSLESISWDDWLEKFDERRLSLLVQDETSAGEKSNFNKLVARQKTMAAGSSRPRR
jgi:ferritin-like metal-binding protein YciE